MTITTTIIAQWFDKFNNEYWNGYLPTPRFAISKASYRTLGQHTYQSGFLGSFGHKITIYNYYDRTEHNFQQTLLHEMCHLYVAVKYNKSGHGAEWKREVARINRFGWNITRCTNLDEEGVHRVVKGKRARQNGRKVCIMDMNSTTKFICCFSKTADTNYLLNAFSARNPKLYSINDESVFTDFATTGKGMRTITGKKVKKASDDYKKYLSAISEI